MRRALRTALVTSLAAIACGKDSGLVPLGQWGGSGITFEVTATGATATLKCRQTATAERPLNLDASGHFSVPASYESPLVLGGPKAAELTGSVNGTSMTLSILVGTVTLGPYELESGAAGAIPVCNF